MNYWPIYLVDQKLGFVSKFGIWPNFWDFTQFLGFDPIFGKNPNFWSDWEPLSTALSQSFSRSRLFDWPHWGLSKSTDLRWWNPLILKSTKPNPTFLSRATLIGYKIYREVFYSIALWYKVVGNIAAW